MALSLYKLNKQQAVRLMRVVVKCRRLKMVVAQKKAVLFIPGSIHAYVVSLALLFLR
jgi:hypothetical protein